MGKTKNINILKEKNVDYIYCGRGKGEKNNPKKCQIGEYGWLGNPIVIGKKCQICHQVHNNGGSTLACYEKYLHERLVNDKQFSIAFYTELPGQTLGCFCKPNPCHTDVMIKYLDAPLSLSKEEVDKILNDSKNEDPWKIEK